MSNLIRQGDANLAAFGQFGGEVLLEGETSATGKVVVAILSLANGTTHTTNDTTVSEGLDLAGQGIPAGVTVYGRWTKLTISGTNAVAIVYYGE